ncbi:MAG: hypothetical protein K6B46_00465 [Opitutales bacterium]|nr:hypothetical protein [Opitutales bacterium]
MIFNSLDFALFLPLVFLLHWFVFARSARAQNFFLLLASYIFYGYWDWRFLFLIAFTTIATWLSGLAIGRSRGNGKKVYCGLNIFVNLSILAVFKYYNFFAREFAAAFLGGNEQNLLLDIVLPVGISFYTFSALSYTIDLYRQKISAAQPLLNVAAYLSFFPQLFAGPIGRAAELFPQYSQKRLFDNSLATDGLRQMLWGFFKKMLVADNCAKIVDLAWADYTTQSGSLLFIAAILYSIQIYCDFSAYSDMAIGCAKLFGIRISPNFKFPYFSRNVAEFWRRWHISLNAWFRDYLYIPLGGSREGRFKTIRNTLIIFTVCGFWHGANWTFIVWGLFHGLLFVPRLLLGGKRKKETDVVAADRAFPSIRECLQIAGTFTLVTIGWVFFRAPSIHDAFAFFEQMLFSGTLLSFPHGIGAGGKILYLFIVFLFAAEWLARRREHALARVPVKNIFLRWAFYFALICLILQYDGGAEQFIYFQF